MSARANGSDDLDLDGNWAPIPASKGAGGKTGELEEPSPDKRKKRKKREEDAAATVTEAKKKRKKLQEDVAEVEQAPLRVGKKKKLKKPKTLTRQSLDGAAVVAEAPPVPQASAEGKKKRKKRRRVTPFDTYEEAARATSLVGDEKSRTLMCRRLEAAWEVEAKANQMSSLEKQEIRPLVSWFVPCAEDATVANLPQRFHCSEGDESHTLRTLLALRDGKQIPTPTPRSISLAVLVPSVDRVFAAVGEMREGKAWRKVKPLVLAAHGGGRKREQVMRQAEALKKGAVAAVATPGRLLRLFEEGHVQAAGMEMLVLDLTRDVKQRDILKMPETRKELFALLRRHLLKPVQGERTRLIFCGA